MKVVLICMNGITTSLLANRLQQYSKDNGNDDEFLACRVGTENEEFTKADVIVLAPQAASFYNKVLQESKNNSSAVIVLDEKMFVVGETKDIYNYIRQNVAGFLTDINTSCDDKSRSVDFTMTMLGEVLLNAILGCLPLLFIGLVFYVLFVSTSRSIFVAIFEAIYGYLYLYVSFSIGFKYGNQIRSNPYVMGTIVFASTMILKYDNDKFMVSNVVIETDLLNIFFTTLQEVAITTVISVMTIALLELFRQKTNIKFPKENHSIVMFSQAFVIDIVLIVFLLIRVLLS